MRFKFWGLNVKYRAQRGRNSEKMAFLSPKKANCEVSLRKGPVFSDLGIKFSVNVTKLSINFFNLKGGGGNSLPWVRHWSAYQIHIQEKTTARVFASLGHLKIRKTDQKTTFLAREGCSKTKKLKLSKGISRTYTKSTDQISTSQLNLKESYAKNKRKREQNWSKTTFLGLWGDDEIGLKSQNLRKGVSMAPTKYPISTS